jgi:hypothetical protein
MVWKKASVIQFKVEPGNLPGCIEKSKNNLRQYSQFPGRDLNPLSTRLRRSLITNQSLVTQSGLVVIVLAMGYKVRRFNPG